jgi:type IV pilus assembly protein PilE
LPSAPHRGFTLLEVLIVAVVLAVLAAIALPSYSAHLRKSARAEAQTFLTSAANSQQQFLIDRRSYAGSLATLKAAPPSDLTGKYNFALATTAGPPPTFTLTATATGNQAKDVCPTLTLDSSGTKSPDTCW